ncbi:unnamed protein product [Owenia fusiformis]|uniref:Nerve growth factor-related domain-containing protein n=1 Tax=Owenia fusiformis TaxID=6347 RepID=A0A8S4NPV7_OWEFU|nr:unnamed protein product [Owenia fusiformis]
MDLRAIDMLFSIVCAVATIVISAPTMTSEPETSRKGGKEQSMGHSIRHFSRFRNYMLALLDDNQDNTILKENNLMDTLLSSQKTFKNQHHIKTKKRKNKSSKKARKWQHKDTKMFVDACKSKSQFERVTTGINMDMETVEVLPNTFVWTSKCVKENSKCHSYGYGVETQCQQKNGWVQVVSRLSPDHAWKHDWIVVENGCSCAIRRID